MIIAITGTPGTGKTWLARKLAKQLNAHIIDMNTIIRKEKLHEGYDHSRKCYIVDEKKVAKHLEEKIKKSNSNVIIDSHISHFLSPELINICIVTKADLKTIKKRLKRRGYSEKKIRENLDAEIFESCHTEALEQGHNVMVYKGEFNSFLKKLIKNLCLCPSCHRSH